MMLRHPPKVNLRDYDPIRQLLAAVVLQAVRDCSIETQISLRDRETAKFFLSGEEGINWLRAFGISDRKAQEFVNNGYRIGGWNL